MQKTLIVYVDDDPDDREILVDAFSHQTDYRFVALASGNELFSFLAHDVPAVCLLILDINMPVQSGIEVLSALQKSEQYRDIPVVMLTTGTESPHAKALRESGIEVIEKPDTLAAMHQLAEILLPYCSSANKLQD